MNVDQDRQMLMVDDNVRNQFRENAVQNVGHLHGNGNVVAARAKGNSNKINGNQIRCYNCKGEGHYSSNCTVKPRKRDVAYLQTQLHIAQKDEAGIQINSEEFDFIAVAGAYDKIEKITANCNLQDNLQQASTSDTQSDKALVYDSDGSAEVHHSENCYDNDIFNMFTQEEQYTELLEPILEPHEVQQNDSNVIYTVSSVEQSGGIVEKHSVNVEETRVLYDSLYNNLAIEVEKVNSEKYDKLERCYQKSVYQEQCLTKKINALHLSYAKQITTLNEEITNLNNQLSNEKSTVSFLQEERKRLKNDFKTREDELLDKQIQLENKIKEIDNILVKTGQSIQTMHLLSPKPDLFYHTKKKITLGYQNSFYLKQAQQKQQSLYNGKVLLEKHDPPAVYDSEETLQLAQESRLKMKQLNKEIKPANYTKINHLSGVFVSQTAKSREELYFSNTSKTANVSKSISIPNEEFSDDTTPSVARKFLNEVKSTIVTLQRPNIAKISRKRSKIDNKDTGKKRIQEPRAIHKSENQANLHAGQQEANQHAGTEDIIDAGDSEKEDESAQDCFVLPIWPSYSSTINPVLQTDDKREGPREEEQVFMDELERLKRQEQEANEEAEALRKKFAQETENLVIQEGAAKPSSTNIFSTVSTPAKASSTNLVNTVSIPVSTASPHEGLSLSDPTNPEEDDSEIPPLEDIYQNSTDGIFTTSSYDDEGAVADFTNLETVVNVSPIPIIQGSLSHLQHLF
ncbi:retrovirus-related pol polyprotein from transposon TNT 1-94 [Tanacetum coccineum]|uniref:Retrovirus-related pol polyprotein from transposon TNT 1-94 n=1 Tax=Tanacetum coccineum TaxID=301880 RepID=A0ABQ4ZXA9_9ASTR